ncbi:MAG TPA: LUD domain-containing protein [Kineosporiaceae bacterium]|nr:LUD domain-containing protein [Kineosporiaceae bacterium]
MTARDQTTRDPAAKEQMLARIRAAIGTPDPAPTVVARQYRLTGPHAPGSPELIELLADRLTDYKATVHRCSPDGVAAAAAAALAAREAQRVVVPAGMAPVWQDWPGSPVPDDVEHPLGVTELDAMDGVITGCAVAIAETGTIVLDGSTDCGRRAITLVPDYHLVVVRADQVVGSVPEGVARLTPSRPLTMISGPSATSDIELSRVEGVHGPRTLVVVLVE